jgi:hypothetical protein
MLEGVNAFKQEVAYKEASDLTEMTVETLRQFVHAARRVLIRVNGVSFGHHRLVAKFYPDRETFKAATLEKGRPLRDDERQQILGRCRKKQQKELLYARNNRLSVEKFDQYLKGLDRADKVESKTPTNADAAATTFMRRCDDLLEKASLGELLRCEPPEPGLRDALVEKLKHTADELIRSAEELRERWTMYDPQAVAVGFRKKEDFEEWKRRREISLNKSATAGGDR